MEALLIIKLLHVICFVYWLGGDLGTFYASKFVAKPELGIEARSTALTIMMGCDQAPRFSMPLIFPLGLELAVHMGFVNLSMAWLGIMWLVCFLWLAIVVILHFAHGKAFIPKLTTFDFYLRIIVILTLLGFGFYALQSDVFVADSWAAYKIIIFALLVGCGLFIRVGLKPFIVAWGQLMSDGPSDDINGAITKSLKNVKPFVYAIWVGLFTNAALGLHLIG